MTTRFREVVERAAKDDAWTTSVGDPRAAYPAHYREHLDEAFSALIFFVRETAPDAELRYLGSDMGGPIYKVVGDGGGSCG